LAEKSDSKRILVTGLSTYWGGRLAQALERDPSVEAIIGIDRRPPKVELERTEFVQVSDAHSLIRRIVDAAEIDTIVDTRLVVDSIVTSSRRAHENNVIGTMNILAACTGGDSPVRKVVVKSSAHYYGCEQDDPAFFTEDHPRRHPPRTPIERDIVEAEELVRDFAVHHPDRTVTVLRFVNGIGPGLRTSHSRLLSLPVVLGILGFDPRYQFIHEDDIVGVLEHATRHDIPGAYNAAGDGVLVLSEVADLLGKQLMPVLPPWGTGLAFTALRRAGLRFGPEVERQLRFGRGVDNRRLKATGYRFRYTSRETVIKLREHQRVDPLLRGSGSAYRYEREVEDFLRRSNNIRRRPSPAAGGEPPEGFDSLDARELIKLIPSLEPSALQALREHEQANRARRTVLTAIDANLVRQQTS
jgi:UDP-glucose 4-epimerase